MPEEPEVPICRVCRSEGTAEEPLFYPCRCSGSIKYVHQVCLEEWLAHSNKKFCELCGYEYAFSPLYDPSMPESIPKRLIIKQMLANVSMIMLQVIRATVVLGMWGFMLPYVIYWITRVLIWFAQTVVYSLGSTDVFLNDFRDFDTTNMTSVAATANLRFKGYNSWRDWYVAFHNDTTVPPIASRTGVLNGANHVADVLYTGTQVCLRLSFQFLHSVLGVSISEAQINDLVEVIVELAAKCFEGSVIVVLSLVTFFILFILRDWVVTNAPLEEDFGEAVVEEQPNEFVEAAAADADVDAEAVVPDNDNDNDINIDNNIDNAADAAAANEPVNLRAGPAVAPVLPDNPDVPDNHVQIQEQPIFAEEPQPQQPFEQPGFDLPLLDDIPPDELPVRQYRRRLLERQPFAASEAANNNSDNHADASDGSGTESDGSDEFQMLARGLINRVMTAVETHVDASSDRTEHPPVQRSNTWSYADEVYEEQSDAESRGSDTHPSNKSGKSPVIKVDIEDATDNASGEGSSGTRHVRPAASDDDQQSPWSLIAGETSGTRNASILEGISSSSSSRSTESLPPVFTSETSRNIPARANLDGEHNDEIGNMEDYAEQEHRIELRLRQLEMQANELVRGNGLFDEEERRRMHENLVAARRHVSETDHETLNQVEDDALLEVSDVLPRPETRTDDTLATIQQQILGLQEPQPPSNQDRLREIELDLARELEQRERELDPDMHPRERLQRQNQHIREWKQRQEQRIAEELREGRQRIREQQQEQILERQQLQQERERHILERQQLQLQLQQQLREQHILQQRHEREQQNVERLRLRQQQILQQIEDLQRPRPQANQELLRENGLDLERDLELREQELDPGMDPQERLRQPEQHIREWRQRREQQPAPPGDRNPQMADIEAGIPPALNQNNAGANGDDFDENFGDFEAADGVLEAMGLRGPFFNAVQYFMLLFMVVVAVLVVCAWIPLVLGRVALTFSPVLVVLYMVHFNLSMVYTVTKLGLAIPAHLVGHSVRPYLVYIIDAIDRRAVTTSLPILSSVWSVVLSIRGSAARTAALWRFLASPEAEDWLEKPIHRLLTSVGSYIPSIASALDMEQLSHKTAGALANFFAGMTSSDLGTTYIEDFTNTRLVADPATDMTTNTSLFQPLWTYMSKFLHELGYVKQWEHGIWTSVASWDTRIVRLADHLREISRGLTFADRFTLIVIGIIMCVYLAWRTVKTTPPEMRHKAHYQFSRMIMMMAKIVFFVVIEIVMFPMLCGYCMAISLTPLIPEADRSSYYWAIMNNSLSRRAFFWLLGLMFMIEFAQFVAYCRRVMRPGLLWFIRDPNDAEFHPMREALEDRPISQQSKISRSAVMYCGSMLVCVGVPSIAAAKIAPEAFPLRWDTSVGLSHYPVSVLYAVLSLFILIKWGRPYILFRFLLDHWWQFAARTCRLSEFILNQPDALDEGRWVIRRYPLMPVLLPRLWMPTHVITEAYEEVSRNAADKARSSDPANAIPTHEFNTLFQNKIDAALAESHPWVEFVLDGQNVRVPALDTVAIVAGRQMLVPVDDFGRPVEDRFDYEAADYPELQNRDRDNANQDVVRDLPPPAPDNSFRDLRFKATQHRVIHVPPSLRMRVCMFMFLGWVAIASFVTVTFVLSLKIGWLCVGRMEDMPRNDIVVLAMGLLLLLIGCESIYQLGVYIGSIYDLDGSWTQRFDESKRQIWRTLVTAWKTLITAFVFLGVMPALYGMVVEVYLVTIARTYLEREGTQYAFARTLIQAMGHNWLFSSLHMWIAMSLLRLFPNSRLARAIDRLFVGPPHTWQVWRAIVEIGVPVGGMALLCSSLPFGLAIIDLWLQDRLTTEHVSSLIMMNDIRLVAKNSVLVILSAASAGIVWQACIIYKRWSRLARDRMYLVGQQLQNLGDNDLEEVDQDGDDVDDFHPDEADDQLVAGAE